nr:MAG TPA: hypothetical protein [Caudoviricetes sp.]
MTTANRVVPDRYGVINIGKLKENLVTEVSLPAPGFAGGSYAVLLKRPKEEQPYPVSVRHDGGNLVWTVQTADTAIAGMGKLECRWYGDNGEVAKSQIYTVRITDGLPDPKEAPEAWAGFLQQVNRDAGRAESAADNAANTLKKLEDGIASGDFRGEKGEQGEKGDPGPQGPQGEPGPAGDTTAAAAAAAAAKQAAQEAQKAADASAGSAAQAAESVGGLADDLEATQKDIAKMKRAIQFQAELNKGQTWDFETDSQETYQRQVPSGAKAGAVMEWGGKTVAWNQLCQNAELTNLDGFVAADFSVITVADGIITANCKGANPGVKSSDDNCFATINHYYYIATTAKIEAGTRYYAPYCNSSVFNVDPRATGTGAFVRSSVIAKAINSGPAKIGSRIATTDSGYYEGVLQMKQPVFIDLTLLFGPGNEPTDTSDPRIAQIEAYAAAHPEYNAGELVSALVDEVLVRGRNLIDDTAPDNIINYNDRITYAYDNGVHKFSGNQSAQQIDTFFGPLYSVRVEAGKIYRLSFDVLAKNTATHIYISKSLGTNSFYLEQADGSIIVISETKVVFGNSGAWNRVTCTFAATLTGNATLHMTIDVPDLYGVGSACWYKNIQFTAADITAYAPYHDPALYVIPAAVRNLPGYGWSAGSVANTVESTDNGWQYVQRVGRWVYDGTSEISADNNYGETNHAYNYVYDLATMNLSKNSAISTVGPSHASTADAFATGGVFISSVISIYIPNQATDGNTMREFLDKCKAYLTAHPVTVYYELATPITTDITDLMGDSLAPFAVEAGGSITLHHPKADEGFAIDVPAKIQYITKLSEVSANG